MLGGGGDGDASDGGVASRIVKLRGLPFSATVSDVLEFLGDQVTVAGGADGVHLRETRPGRASGECFVELATSEDVARALAKDKENLGKRYVEVFESDKQEMKWALNLAENGNGFSLTLHEDAGVVKLRGLPYGCSPDDVRSFFQGLAVAPDGINILSDHAGRPSGEAFVHFIDKDSAQLALERDREKIGHRYIEVFVSSADEVRAYAARLEAGGGGGGGAGGARGGGALGRGYGRPAPYDRNDRFGGGGRLGRGPPGPPPPYRPDTCTCAASPSRPRSRTSPISSSLCGLSTSTFCTMTTTDPPARPTLTSSVTRTPCGRCGATRTTWSTATSSCSSTRRRAESAAAAVAAATSPRTGAGCAAACRRRATQSEMVWKFLVRASLPCACPHPLFNCTQTDCFSCAL